MFAATGDLPFGKTVCPVWSVEDLDSFGGAVVWVWLVPREDKRWRVLCEDEWWLVRLDFARDRPGRERNRDDSRRDQWHRHSRLKHRLPQKRVGYSAATVSLFSSFAFIASPAAGSVSASARCSRISLSRLPLSTLWPKRSFT